MGKKVTMAPGSRYGRFIVISETSERTKNGSIKYLCRCDCGTEKVVDGVHLRDGQTKSCGCYNYDLITRFGNAVYNEPLYHVWSQVKDRCRNPKNKAYKNYGGRGITLCDEWKADYSVFRKWANENGYKRGLWLDRIDNDKGYSPQNCKWSTTNEQARNKRTTVYVELNGEMVCLTDAAEITGIGFSTLKRRIELGWRGEDLFLPVKEKYSHSNEIKEGIKRKKDLLPFEPDETELYEGL